MSILSSFQKKHPLAELASKVGTELETNSSRTTLGDACHAVCSLESLDDAQLSVVGSTLATTREGLSTSLSSIIESIEDPTEREVALEAAAYAAIAGADGKTFLNSFRSTKTIAQSGVEVVQGVSLEGADYQMEDVSFEAFENQPLDNFRANNVIFNCLAAIGDPFSEAFYPTHNVAPGETGWSMSVKQEVILESPKRNADGSVTNFGKVRILDAMKDHRILESNSTECIPAVKPDGSNEKFFVDKTLMPFQTVIADGQSIKTGALSINQKVDIVAISSGYGEIAGQQTAHTDQLDPRLGLKSIVFKLTSGADGSTEEAVEVNVMGLPGTDYTPTMNGESRGVQLQFSTSRLPLTKAHLKQDGTVPAALQALFDAGYTLFLDVTFTAQASLEYASNDPMAKVAFAAAYKDGSEFSMDDDAVKAAMANVKIAVEGYRLDSRRTNSNLRNRGKTADTTSRTQHYVLPFGAPLHALAPLDGQGSGVGVSTLINLASVRSANNAVTALERQAEQLKAYQKGAIVEGIAASVLNPTFIEDEFDAMQLVNSDNSHERAEALKSALVDKLRVIMYDLVRDSGYKTALELESGNRNAKVEAIIGTDENIIQHLMVTGDERTMSVGVNKFTIVTTPDFRMYDTIYIALGCGKENGIHAFNHGTRGYMPAPTVELERQRDGEVLKETIVRPRDLHVNNVPVLARVRVKNLAEYLGRGIGTKLVTSANEVKA